MEMVYDAIAAFFIAMLSGMGLGSGGFFVIYLTLLSSHEQLTAQYLNLIFFLFSSGAAMLYHALRRKINFGTVLVLALFGAIGSFPGTALASILHPIFVRKGFGVFLVLSGVLSLFGKSKKDSENTDLPHKT